jgi:hypothetical protein
MKIQGLSAAALELRSLYFQNRDTEDTEKAEESGQDYRMNGIETQSTGF